MLGFVGVLMRSCHRATDARLLVRLRLTVGRADVGPGHAGLGVASCTVREGQDGTASGADADDDGAPGTPTLPPSCPPDAVAGSIRRGGVARGAEPNRFHPI